MKRRSVLLTAAVIVIAGVTGLVYSCRSVKVPEGITVVKDFKIEPYMGTWYEIARFDFRFEKDLNNTSAQYKLDKKGM